MQQADVALIGGTGIGERLAGLGGRALFVPTPFGTLRGRLVSIDAMSLYVVQRHAIGHRVPPHGIAYQAMADGVRRLGVRACFSSATVGSLRSDWPIGTLASCTDFLDVSARVTTLFDSEVRHTDFSQPFPLAPLLQGVQSPCVYACVNGPRYETPHEIALMRQLGADVVGMTAASEAIAMREAGVPYGCLAVVSNLGTGLSSVPLDHGDVSKAMSKLGGRVTDILFDAARRSL